MPPRNGGGGVGSKKRNKSLDNQHTQRTPTATTKTTTATSNSQRTGLVRNSLMDKKTNQQQFNIAPLVLEGIQLNKLQLNDILKQHFSDIKISDIQLARSGNFTLFATDVKSFNRLLNELTSTLSNNGYPGAKIFVPRSIQRIKDTEKVAFVKRVDLEIPVDRMAAALKDLGLDVTEVTRLSGKDGKTPTRTVKISFSDVQNRNTFVHTGLQVDCMHFTAEPASQNNKPVQCYICLKYNHVAKYCRTKQQVCARCGDNHRMDQCTVANDAVKCSNCKGNHLANSKDCSQFKEQEKRMLNLINQYSTTSKPTTSVPALHDLNQFPSLPNPFQTQQNNIQNDLFDRMINMFSSKMEKLIEETTSRLFQKLQQKIKKIEKSIGLHETSPDEASTISDSDSIEDGYVVKHIKNKKHNNNVPPKTTESTIEICSKAATASNVVTSKQQARKQKEATQSNKRALSPNSSMEASTNDNIKDLKTNNNDDSDMPHQH